MYDRYLQDPSSVDEAWRELFKERKPDTSSGSPAPGDTGPNGRASAPSSPPPSDSAAPPGTGTDAAASKPVTAPAKPAARPAETPGPAPKPAAITPSPSPAATTGSSAA